MVDNNSILFVLSTFDRSTLVFSSWIYPAIKMAKDEGHDVTVLIGEDATREKFIDAIETKDPLLVIFVGHGTANMVTGQNKEPLLILGDKLSAELMKGRYAIFYSCTAGQSLIPYLISNGLLGAISFDDIVFWVGSPMFFEYEENDPWFYSFRQVFYSMIETILKGGNMYDAYHRAVVVTNEEIQKYQTEGGFTNHDVIFHLMKNRNMMNVYQRWK